MDPLHRQQSPSRISSLRLSAPDCSHIIFDQYLVDSRFLGMIGVVFCGHLGGGGNCADRIAQPEHHSFMRRLKGDE